MLYQHLSLRDLSWCLGSTFFIVVDGRTHNTNKAKARMKKIRKHPISSLSRRNLLCCLRNAWWMNFTNFMKHPERVIQHDLYNIEFRFYPFPWDHIAWITWKFLNILQLSLLRNPIVSFVCAFWWLNFSFSKGIAFYCRKIFPKMPSTSHIVHIGFKSFSPFLMVDEGKTEEWNKKKHPNEMRRKIFLLWLRDSFPLILFCWQWCRSFGVEGAWATCHWLCRKPTLFRVWQIKKFFHAFTIFLRWLFCILLFTTLFKLQFHIMIVYSGRCRSAEKRSKKSWIHSKSCFDTDCTFFSETTRKWVEKIFITRPYSE